MTESEKIFFESLMKVQAELPSITKTKEAKISSKGGFAYSYKYADFATMIKLVTPVLHKHGFIVTCDVAFDGDECIVTTMLRHLGGHMEAVAIRLRRGVTPQDTGSAITYARRYGLQCILGIAADEDDDAASVTESVRASVHAEVEAMLEEAESLEPGTRERFLKYFKVKDVQELSGDALATAKKLLEAKIKNMRGGQR